MISLNKNWLYIATILTILILLKISYSYVFNKGYSRGYDAYDKLYQEKLKTDLETERNKIKEEYDDMVEKIKKNQKVEIIYKDRIKLIKQVTSADNMKCEMTDEQVKKLNEFIKFKS